MRTRTRSNGERDRGQVGIGTLIVFIAMILVAALAAGVLINTAGSLHSQASDTGSESQDAVANQIQVVHASGEINQSEEFIEKYDDPYLELLNFTVMKSPGADPIDLSAMTIQYTSDEVDQTLTYNDSPRIANYKDPNYANGWEEFLTEGEGETSETLLATTDDRIELIIHVRALEEQSEGDLTAGSGSPGLEPGDQVTIKFSDQSGAQFTYGVSVPSTFGEKDVVVV